MYGGDRESDLARILVGGMIGGVCGAVVGLVLFGGVIFVPALVMGLGVWIGIAQAANHMDMESRTRRMLRAAFRHQPPRMPDPRIKATRQRTASSQAAPARRPARSGGSRSTRSGASSAIVTGPVRLANTRTDLPPIDLNSADVDELSRLPGVGKAAAARIVAHREAHGPFGSLRQLEAVEGFDGGRVARLSPRATLSPPGAVERSGKAQPVVPA